MPCAVVAVIVVAAAVEGLAAVTAAVQGLAAAAAAQDRTAAAAAAQGLGPTVTACMCVAEGAGGQAWRRRARRCPRRGGGAQVEAGQCLVRVFAGEHSTAQYVVGRSSEECCG